MELNEFRLLLLSFGLLAFVVSLVSHRMIAASIVTYTEINKELDTHKAVESHDSEKISSMIIERIREKAQLLHFRQLRLIQRSYSDNDELIKAQKNVEDITLKLSQAIDKADDIANTINRHRFLFLWFLFIRPVPPFQFKTEKTMIAKNKKAAVEKNWKETMWEIKKLAWLIRWALPVSLCVARREI